MALTIDDLPLEFRPRKWPTTMVFTVFILLELAFAVGFEFNAKWPVQAFFTTGIISTLSFLFMVGVCVFGIYQAQTSRDRLVIDETGVTLVLHGAERRWAWTDMARFHVVLVHKRTKLHMVAIERWGETAFDAKANVIWPRFGPSTDALIVLLRAGKARWGAA